MVLIKKFKFIAKIGMLQYLNKSASKRLIFFICEKVCAYTYMLHEYKKYRRHSK